jgi:hypothetical protein
MSNDSPKHRRPPATRGRVRWYAAGLTGVAGLAALSAITGATGPISWNDRPSAPKQVLPAGYDDNDGPGGHGANGWPGKNSDGNEESVPCDANTLIAAIDRANAAGGARLTLAENCVYILTTPDGTAGLPVITQPVTIDGQGAIIARLSSAANFRIVAVGAGGDLTLQDLTIEGGFAPASEGGGGILVQAGGRATLRNTTVASNSSVGVGGGIANYGITTILGRAEHDYRKDAEEDANAEEAADAEKVRSGVKENSAQTSGGGIFNRGLLTTDNIDVSFNKSGSDGGGLANRGTAVSTKTGVDHNTAGAGGGGISNVSALATIKESSVSDNTATGTGGGILEGSGSLYVQRTEVNRNTATGDGGGIANIGPAIIIAPAFATVEDSEIRDNATQGNGGGIVNNRGVLVVRRSDVSVNRATGTTSRAGGIYNFSLGSVSLAATRVTENSATVAPGGVFTDDTSVTVDQKSVIIGNQPTNCTGSPTVVPNCSN